MVFLYLGVPWIYIRFLRFSLQRKVTKAKALVLTFDDGPSNELTPAVLNILDEHNVKATFFLKGTSIIGRGDFVRRISAGGHEIGSHGFRHLHSWKVSPIRTIVNITQGWETIDAALGIRRNVYPFRPPYGKLNLVCLLYLWFRRAPIIYWTLDSGDTWPCDKHDSQRIASLAKKAGGAVTLAHDFERSDKDVERLVVDLTRSALDMAKEAGMQVLTISQLLLGNHR